MELVTNEKTLDPDRKINYQFKVLYAIGIIFVVAGHANANDIIFWNELIHCTGWYMAMFVFASGYFYKSSNDEHPLAYIWKKVKRLMVPYFLWNIFYGIVVLILSKFGFTIAMPFDWRNFLFRALCEGPGFKFNLPAWFVIPLFFSEVYNVLIRFCLKKLTENKRNIVLLVLNTLIGFFGIYIAMQYTGKIVVGLPLFGTRLAYFIAFFTFGYMYKMYVEKYDTLSNFWYFTIIISIELLYILIKGESPVYSIIGMFNFENPVLPYIMGLVGLAFWLRIARILTPVVGHSKKLNMIADNTFSIMTNHEFGFFLMNTGFYFLTAVCSLPLKFDVEKYKTSVEYIFLPRGRGFPMVYVAFAIVFSLLIQKLAVFLKGRLYSVYLKVSQKGE